MQVDASLAEPLTLDAGSFVYMFDSSLVLSGALVSDGAVIDAVGQITGPVTVDGSIVFLTQGQLLVSGDINESSPDSSVVINEGGFAGTVDLSGTCTCTGLTDVGNGTLQVDGAINSAGVRLVSGGGTLDGSGTINAPVTVNSGGTLQPGDNPGILTADSVALSTGSNYDVALGGSMPGTQYDQLKVSGDVNLGNGNLQVTLASGYRPAVGTQFEIVNNTGPNAVTNTFAGLPEGSTFSVNDTEFSITYKGGDGNDVVLTVVPQLRHWTGLGSDNLWSDPANWQGDYAPEAGDILAFQGTPQTTFNDFPTDTAFGGIQFLSPSGFGTGGSELPTWQVTGHEVVLGGADAILSNPSPAGSKAVISFNLPVQLNSDMTVLTTSSNSAIEFFGTIDTAGHTLSVDAQGEALVVGDIIGSGGLTLKEGFLELSGTNSYTGPTLLQSGIMHADSQTAFGDPATGTEVGPGVVVQVDTSLAEPLVLDAGAAIYDFTSSVLSGPIVSHGGSIAGNVQINAPVTVDGSLSLLVLGSSGLDFSDGIVESSPGSYVAINAGNPAWPTVLSGSSTYTGMTYVNGGTLDVPGTLHSSGVQVSSGATLDGSGTIHAPVVLQAGATLKPSDAQGTLTADSVTFNSGSFYDVALAATQSDQLTVPGTVDLGNSTLQVSLGYTPAVGTQFEIVNNTGPNAVTNTFAGLPEGSAFTVNGTEFSITYKGGVNHNDVVLTVVQLIVNPGSNGSVNEGSTFSRTGSFSVTSTTATYQGTVNYGDGSATQSLTLAANKTFSLGHVYGKGGSYTVTVTVADGQGGTGTGTFVVTVANLPPVVAALTGPPLAIPGQSVSLAAMFTDPGTLDTHTASFNWGDGSTSAGTVTETNGSGSVAGSHVYGATGTYTVTLTVTDEAGASATSTFNETVTSSIYVLDPSAAGALSLSGNASIKVPGVVVVDSSSASALSANGSAAVTASSIQVVGKRPRAATPASAPRPQPAWLPSPIRWQRSPVRARPA